jgi:hypothetical protein
MALDSLLDAFCSFTRGNKFLSFTKFPVGSAIAFTRD